MNSLKVLLAASLIALSGCSRKPEVAPSASDQDAAHQSEKPTVATKPPVTSAMLWQAIVTGDSTTVDTGLSQGIDANLTTSDGVSALMLAASTGNDQTVKALLSRGANPNDATAKHRLTALMFAANACSRPAIDSLLAAHADAELKDSDNGSAADWAFRGCKDPNAAATLIQYLYEKGASIQPRGDAVGLLLAEGAPPPIESLLQAARSQFRSP